MNPTPVNVDIAIIGGGIAGLWLLNRLCNSGYNAVLFEQGSLGGGQSIASQGMIHGGIKYALGGMLTGASEAIADMPNHWRRCLDGEGDVDLRKARVLSDHFYMWSTQSLGSKVTSFFASRMLRGRVGEVSKTQRPPVFQDDAFSGKLYKLVDLVLDVPSVVEALAENCPGRVYSIDWQQARFNQRSDGSVESLIIDNNGTPLALSAQRFILTAGEGNEQLLETLGITKPAMQRRPLHQALFKHDYPHTLYAHCMGSNASPRLTISSHQTSDGKWVWYLGGDLATESVELSKEQLIHKAKQEIDALFPWVDFGDTHWDTLFINRAEPKQKNLLKPDKAFAEKAHGCSNVIVGWPTKLTLAPNMTDEIVELLEKEQVHNSGTLSPDIPDALSALPTPSTGTPCWDELSE